MGVLSITMPFEGERELSVALALLTVIDVCQMKWRKLPQLYRSGVYYEREDAKQCWLPMKGGCEDWLSAEQVIAQGKGDCEDLACYRAAELILKGERARAIPIRTRIGWHIVVRRADGTREDPSRVLGMHGAQGRRDEVAALYARARVRAAVAGAWGV